ncbi:hypothetical protein ACE6H2_002502 [Prunus campanulata]
MSLTEIDCMAVYLGHIGIIDYWYRVEDEGNLKTVEFDSEVIEMCENVPKDYADDVRTPSVILQELPKFDKSIVLHDGLDKATSNEVHMTRKPTPSMNSASAKGKEKVAEVDEGCVNMRQTKLLPKA